MNYIVVDLEWNQSMVAMEKKESMPSEIIEIGAVKLDHEWNNIGSFSELVKPQVYMKLHYMIRDVLNIDKQEFLQGDYFENVVERFFSWCGEDYIFCTWGDMDLTELQKNIAFYGLEGYIDKPIIYYDIQKLFRLQYESGKIIRTLEYAVDFMEIPKMEPFHRALSDAKYTALVLQKMDKKMIPHNYSIDCFHNPKDKSEEIHIIYETYSKYVSKEFDTKDEVFKSVEVASSRCCKCGKGAAKKIRWFTRNGRRYYCLAFCREHGFIKGKIIVKRTLEGKYFAIKTLNLVDEETADNVRRKQEELKVKKTVDDIKKRKG